MEARFDGSGKAKYSVYQVYELREAAAEHLFVLLETTPYRDSNFAVVFCGIQSFPTEERMNVSFNSCCLSATHQELVHADLMFLYYFTQKKISRKLWRGFEKNDFRSMQVDSPESFPSHCQTYFHPRVGPGVFPWNQGKECRPWFVCCLFPKGLGSPMLFR